MGDWIDPYFINFLLEHWYRSVLRLTNPASPPMYFPTRGTLGYSHGLILFAPFYAAVRPFLHPFQAYNATVFLVLNTGTIGFYVIVRKFVRLGFIESLLLTAFFVSSPNVINEPAGIWAQRVSVFLIPGLILMALVAARGAGLAARNGIRETRPTYFLAWLTGLGCALLFIQDFYTAAFAVLVWALFLAGALPLSGLSDRFVGWLNANRACVVAAGVGALMGGVLFGRIYLHAYREHPSFPENQLNNALTALEASHFDFRKALRAYPSLRSFELAFVAAAMSWVPGFPVERRVRLCALWFAVVSLIILAIPLRIDKFSIWKMLFSPVPGWSSIRDPKRVIECYELMAGLLAAVFLARLPKRSPVRVTVALVVFLLIVTDWNRSTFNFARPIDIYARWVEPPIEIDPSCESFFIKGASDAYMSRSSNQWSLYNIDAMFISLRTSIPTLNGYSAWWPDGWRLSNPQTREYLTSVEQWIAQNGLRNVCALDIDALTMKRYVTATAPP